MGLMKTKHTVALSLFYLVSWLLKWKKQLTPNKQLEQSRDFQRTAILLFNSQRSHAFPPQYEIDLGQNIFSVVIQLKVIFSRQQTALKMQCQ